MSDVFISYSRKNSPFTMRELSTWEWQRRGQNLRVFVLAFFLLLLMPVIDAQEAPAPYLYYYSGILNAFVIEHADGTDSRTLAQGVIPQTHNEIDSPKWSPSGKWLAWRSAEYGGLSPSPYLGWIISSDGLKRLTILDHPDHTIVTVNVMEWASDADLLFVVQSLADENGDNISRQLLLINAEEEVVVVSYSYDTPYFHADYGVPFVWLSDGKGVVAYESDFQDGLFTSQIIALLIDGSVETEVYSAWATMGLSPDGRFAYISEDQAQLVVRELLDDSTETYPLANRLASPEFSQLSDQLIWSSDYNIAAYFMRQEDNFELWLLNRREQELTFLQTDVTDFRVRCENNIYRLCNGIWSPNGLRFIFKTTNETHWLFELYSQEITALGDFPEYDTITWANNSQQLILENEEDLYIYDVISQQHTLVSRLISYGIDIQQREGLPYFPSPDGAYMGLTSSRIVSLLGGSSTDLTIHSGAVYATSMVWEYNWHKDGEWVITGSNVTYAGCCGPQAYTVLNVNRSGVDNRRELTVRWGESAGWIPERVVPHLAEGQPQSVLQQPTLTHHFSDRVIGLTWNPNSSEIATVTHSGDVFVRTMDSRMTQQPMFVINGDCVRSAYGLPCPMYWENETIVAGDRAWNIDQQNYVTLSNEDRIQCDHYGCREILQEIFSSDGRWVARLSDTNIIEVIAQYTNQVIERFEVETFETITPFQWVNDRLIMIAAHQVTILNANTGEITTLESVRDSGYEDRFFLVRISPDETFVAGASIETPIHIWDIETGELVTVINWYGYDIAFSPDNQWLAAGNTTMVTIWDLSEYLKDE